MNRIIMIALVLMGWTGAWAGDVTVIVGPNANAGTVVASKAAAGQTCTLTVTPASGYYLTKDNLTAVTVVSGDALQGPRRGIDIKSEPVEITASDATADPSGVTTYTFTMPADGNIGVEVTADFQTLIAIEPTVTLQGWTYGDEPNQPVVGNNPGNGEVTFTYAEKGGAAFTEAVPENVGDYTVKASVAAAMQYAAGEATADFSISKAAATITKAPTAKTLTYSGEAQALVEAGTVSAGTMVYSTTIDGTFAETIPTATNAGSYTVYYKVNGDDNHTGIEASETNKVTVTIEAKSIATGYTVTVDATQTYTYTGEAIKPAVTVIPVDGGAALTLNTDYEVSYSNNTNAALSTDNLAPTVTVTGKGNYTGSASATFTIGKAAATITKAPTAKELTYTGEALALVEAGTVSAGTMVYSTTIDGTFAETIPTATNAGTYTVYYKVDGDDNHTGIEASETNKVTVTISAKALTDDMVTLSPAEFVYNAETQKPEVVTVKDGDKVLTLNTDYELTNAGGTNVGSYDVTVTGKGNYAGTITKQFSIVMGAATITKAPTAKTLTYSGEAQALVEAGTVSGGTMVYSTTIDGTFAETIPTATNAGSYTVYYKVNGDDNHTGIEASETNKVTVTISAKALTDDMVTLSDESFVYNAETQKPEVTVKDGDKVLAEGTDYELTNEGGAKVGGHDVIVTGKGNYTGTITKQFSITALKYGLTVNGVEVTNVNANNVLGDVESMVTVTFDGEHQLVLNNYKCKENVFNSIEVSMDSLAIYLIGKNEVADLTSRNGKHKLTFTTDGNDAGRLIIDGEISGFEEVNFEQNLGLYDNVVRVGVDPLVNESGAQKTVDVGNATLPDDQVVNTVIDNVIVTADKSNGDGVNNNTIELGSGMTLDEVVNAIKNLKPGTEEYANAFSGLTFMIPAGTGQIEIELKTGEDGAVAVQIGDKEPIIFKDLMEFKKNVIQFAVQVATYVLVYNAQNSGRFAPGKAGKKTSTSVGIRTVGVRTNKVQASNSPANSNNVPKDEQKSTDEVNDLVKTTDTDGNVKLNDEDAITVVTLPEDMLKEEPYSPSVDFRNTSVTGVFVSRTTGVFNGVSKNTFIFMPVGNNTDEANVIIGSVCQFAQLDGNMKDDEQFAPIDEFVAQRTELTTSFEQGQLATVYLPFAISATDAAGWGTFYKFNGVERGYVKIKEMTGDLEPNVPYLFKPTEDATKIATGVASIVLPKSNAAQRRTDGDQLVGCYSTQTAASGMYLLRSEGTDFKFEQMQAGEKIKPFQAYLKLNDNSTTVLKVTDNEEVPTGIVSVKEQTTAAKWQTLSGITLDKKPQEKGVYIRNGRKIVVR